MNIRIVSSERAQPPSGAGKPLERTAPEVRHGPEFLGHRGVHLCVHAAMRKQEELAKLATVLHVFNVFHAVQAIEAMVHARVLLT